MADTKDSTRCAVCQWCHEVDSVLGTSFMGVTLCSLHAAAPKMRDALRDIQGYLPVFAQDVVRAILRDVDGQS